MDELVTRVENHDAIIESTIGDCRTAKAQTRVRLASVRKRVSILIGGIVIVSALMADRYGAFLQLKYIDWKQLDRITLF